MRDMELGVSTACLFPMETERALARLGELGVETAEVFLNSPSEASPGFIRLLGKIAADYGLRVTALHPYCSDNEGFAFFGRYPRRLEDGLEEYRRMFEAGAALGAGILVFHGAKRYQTFPREVYWERFSLLAEEGQKFGIEVCQENVARCMSGDPGFIREMRQALPEARFVLDTKQARRSGADLFELTEIMSPRLARVHVSDWREDNDCVPPGEGKMPYAPFFHRLRSAGFSGDVIVELYRWGFGEESALARSLRYLESFGTEGASGMPPREERL